MKNILLAGCGTTAQILLATLENDKRFHVIGATVDDEFLERDSLPNLSCYGVSELLSHIDPNDTSVIMAMGYSRLNRNREKMFDRLGKLGFSFETYIHPFASVCKSAKLGSGCVFMASAVIEPEVQVGDNTLVWANATLAHHSVVGKNCWIAAGSVVSGKAKIGDNSFLGVNSTITNEVEIGSLNMIGASAMISKSTKDNKVYLARSGEEHRFTSEQYEEFFGV